LRPEERSAINARVLYDFEGLQGRHSRPDAQPVAITSRKDVEQASPPSWIEHVGVFLGQGGDVFGYRSPLDHVAHDVLWYNRERFANDVGKKRRHRRGKEI